MRMRLFSPLLALFSRPFSSGFPSRLENFGFFLTQLPQTNFAVCTILHSNDYLFIPQVTGAQIEQFCQALSLSKEKYIEQCKKALLTKGPDSEFRYFVENDCFSIKKRLEIDSSTHMNVIFLKIPLQKVCF